MEGIQTLRYIVKMGDWLAKIDLKDAYLTIPINSLFRKFLCFKWEGKFFHFVSMPFGLASAPRAFTKLLRPVVAFLRQRGIRLAIYFDDILILAASREEAKLAVKTVISLLHSLGFVINTEKSVEEPSQSMVFIGLVIHSVPMSFSLTEKKVADVKRLCKEALRSNKISLRETAKILGNFNWAAPAVRFAQAHFRAFQSLYNSNFKLSKGDFQWSFSLDLNPKEDLAWWVSRANLSRGKSITPASPSLTIFSDASNSGWGAVCQDIKTGGPWTVSECLFHINQLEMLAALKALECFTASSFSTSIELRVDNTSAVSYINRLGGCRLAALCSVALSIASWCESKDLELHAIFLPGVSNVLADAESRRPLSSGD